MQIQEHVNLENACHALESVARQMPLGSPELGAIELAAHALLSITEPRGGAKPIESQTAEDRWRTLKAWASEAAHIQAYISFWKDDIARNGTDEQRAFITHITEPETSDFATNGDDYDLETRPFAEILPTPYRAIRVLEELAQRRSSDSLDRVRVEFAIYVLRYTVEHQQVAALGAYLDEAQKRHDPYGHD